MPPGDLHNLGSMIRRHRELAGISLRQLSAAAGIVPSTLLRIESGQSEQPDVKTLQAIARALAVDVEDFYAAAGYLERQGLPELRPYLRAKYGIAGDAANRIEGYVQALRDEPVRTQQQPPKEEPTNDHPRGDTDP